MSLYPYFITCRTWPADFYDLVRLWFYM